MKATFISKTMTAISIHFIGTMKFLIIRLCYIVYVILLSFQKSPQPGWGRDGLGVWD